MRKSLVVLICTFLFTPQTFADDVVFPGGNSSSQLGGLMIVRRGDQTSWSLGGILLRRKVKVVTNTPEGKVFTRFTLPSAFHSPETPWLPASAPARISLEIPDNYGLVFVEGELVRTTGTSRQLESPILAPGKVYPLRIRAAYVIGDKFLIEDSEILIRAGETVVVTFDGTRALIVPLQKSDINKLGQLPERSR